VRSERRLIRQAFRFELNPNQAQRVLLAKSVGARRYVYNWGLAESQREYERTGKRPRHGDLKKRLVGLKRSEAPWLYEVSAHIGQQALVDLEHAFNRFFKGVNGEGPKSGFPHFKRKGERDSARLYEFQVFERHVQLPNIGRIRLKERTVELRGRPIAATITRRANRWFISIAVERERDVRPARPLARPADLVGVDLGLTNAAVIHDGSVTRVVEPRKALRGNLAKLRRLDRQLARKQQGSRNREKAKLRRARLHYRISCQRNNAINQLSSALARTKSVIVLEDLHVCGMQRNKRLALSITDAGMRELRRQLAYKSEWYGSRVLVVDRYYPSSQLCSSCGCLNEQLKGIAGLHQRTFECPACGLSLDRDENAAINLRAYGARQLGIVPLPVDLREVTPVGEEGAGVGKIGAKPASLKQEASGRRRERPNTQRRVERPVGAGFTSEIDLRTRTCTSAATNGLQREQQDDRADHRERKRAGVPAEIDLVAEHDLADEAADQRADEPDRERRQAADPVAPRRDDARDGAGEQPEQDPREPAH
jgi:putative transposase